MEPSVGGVGSLQLTGGRRKHQTQVHIHVAIQSAHNALVGVNMILWLHVDMQQGAYLTWPICVNHSMMVDGSYPGRTNQLDGKYYYW